MLQIIIVTLLFLSQIAVNAEVDIERTDKNILEDARLDTFSLIKKYGYHSEIHRVYTEDRYILELHRVPYGKSGPTEGPRPVVFLQHGLLSSSAEWVLMTPDKGLAYILADSGYDVWMGNARGNTYSRNHATLRTSSSTFWQFSWHEIGYYDLPAMIDYVIKETGVPKIQYIGFSQGTTAFWVMMSTRPEYNDKVIAMQALAPIAYLGNMKSPLIKTLGSFTNSLERLLKLIGANEVLPNGKLNDLAGQKWCVEESFTQVLCTNLLFLICGYDADQLNTTMLPVVLGHTPAGASSRQLIHFGQLYKSNSFARFDHGWLKNLYWYGSLNPPEYNLNNIKVPIFLHYSDNDWLSTPDDAFRLAKEIKSVVGALRVPLPRFNHLDFVFAINASELIYNRVVNIMDQFKNKV